MSRYLFKACPTRCGSNGYVTAYFATAPSHARRYFSFLRREATAADNAAKPVPKRTTVTGSGIGTGPDGGTAVGVSGGKVAIWVGVLVGPGGVLVGVGVLVGIGVLVGVLVDVAVGCSVTVVSAAGT